MTPSPVSIVYDETEADDTTADIFPTVTFFCTSCRAVLGVQVEPEYVAKLTTIHVGKRITFKILLSSRFFVFQFDGGL